MRGAHIIWSVLVEQGVDTVFGYPGGAILPAYDALLDHPIRHVLVRHEQGATHMADGYARASGKVGVAIATSGPGATNLVTGIATAMMDSIPLVCITGQVPEALIGSDAFQETDVTGITLTITKHNFLVTQGGGHRADAAQGVRDRDLGPSRPGARRHHEERAAGRDASSSRQPSLEATTAPPMRRRTHGAATARRRSRARTSCSRKRRSR